LLRCGEFYGGHFAARAFNAIRPAEPNQQFAATFVGIEVFHQIN
jgi:hypothetical protein